MGEYKRLSIEERESIEGYVKAGKSLRFMAENLGRSASTISRELKRNDHWPHSYVAQLAQNRWEARRKRATHALQSDAARAYVTEKLKDKKSPEQISAMMRQENKSFYACHETIYRLQ